MNNQIKIFFIALFLLVAALLQASAQTNTNVAAFHTNLVLNVNIALTAFIQEEIPVSTNRIVKLISTQHLSTRDLINTIATDLGQGTNDLAGAKLLFRSSDVSPNPSFQFMLRKGGKDVILTNELIFSGVTGENVGTERIGSKGTTNESNLGIFIFSLSTSRATADLQGLTKFREGSVVLKGENIVPDPLPASFSASVVGSGFVQGRPAIWKGTISAGARKVEIGEGP
jgi:hypothetical protein